jgi:hypothetical protein
MRADQFFQGECRSRDASKSPTASFCHTKSSKWIENFASLVSDELDYKGGKANVSARKNLGNQYMKETIKHVKKKSGLSSPCEYNDPRD